MKRAGLPIAMFLAAHRRTGPYCCYTACEVFRLAACDLAARGLESGVRALLLSGRQTVRDFLQRAYGCALGPREYFTPSHLTGAQADAKDFLRMLGRAVGGRKRAASWCDAGL